ncbi:MAG: hypothetical protein IJI35_01260 [Kiritimatiellae bacterium]|nr:hypothetical protein [Kiritimatiellia bacterium]
MKSWNEIRNAAVASEALDGTLQAVSPNDDGYSKYVPSDWDGYTNACWAANWFRWFQDNPSDSRGKMGWPDYFSAALGNAGTVYNYYSSGDEVFDEMPSTPSLLSGVFHWPTFQSSWPFVDLSSMVTPEVSPWQKQEVLKGVDNVSGTLAGGWGFHFVSNTTAYVTTWRTYTPAEASAMVVDGSIVTNAVFARNAPAMFNPSATQDAQWETLAKYIPAVSSAVGKVDALSANDRNLNDAGAVSRPNGWGRPASEGAHPWLHSDIKNMALWFVGCFYDEIVTIGGLR